MNLDTITQAEVATWKPGEVLLLTGKLLTGRDAAHKRMVDMLEGREAAGRLQRPLHLLRRPGRSGARRSRRPRRSDDGTRMDKFTEQVLRKTGLIGMVGKAERGPSAIEAIRKHKRCT